MKTIFPIKQEKEDGELGQVFFQRTGCLFLNLFVDDFTLRIPKKPSNLPSDTSWKLALPLLSDILVSHDGLSNIQRRCSCEPTKSKRSQKEHANRETDRDTWSWQAAIQSSQKANGQIIILTAHHT
jgi:hypothetical protein